MPRPWLTRPTDLVSKTRLYSLRIDGSGLSKLGPVLVASLLKARQSLPSSLSLNRDAFSGMHYRDPFAWSLRQLVQSGKPKSFWKDHLRRGAYWGRIMIRKGNFDVRTKSHSPLSSPGRRMRAMSSRSRLMASNAVCVISVWSAILFPQSCLHRVLSSAGAAPRA